METCQPTSVSAVPLKLHDEFGTRQVSWKTFFRQFLVASSIWLSYFQLGLCAGAPTVIIPQLRREANSTAAVSTETVSWLTSVLSYGAIPFCILLPVMLHVFGRKLTFAAMCVTTLAGFILFYCSSSVTELMISEILQGPLYGAHITVSIIILSECTSPRYRGVFLTIKAANFYWGIWVSNAIGAFFYWKNIGILGIVCSVYNIATIFAWPESPYWLASKGRVEQCRASHRWLKGTREDAERELQSLIDSQKINKQNVTENTNFSSMCTSVYKNIKSKSFFVPVLNAILLQTIYNFSGKLIISLYAIDIIKKMTSSESAAYTGMLILDGITVFSMYVGAALSRYLARRTQFFTAQFIATAFLFIMSLYLYLIHISVILENHIMSIALLMCFTICISCGPIVLVITICGELLPLVYRSFSTVVVSLTFTLILGIFLKTAPFMFATWKMHGSFMFLGIGSLFCGLISFKYLPETKDKTLTEIQSYFKDK